MTFGGDRQTIQKSFHSFFLRRLLYDPLISDYISSPSVTFCDLVYQQFLIVTLRSWPSKMQSSGEGHES